jgi:hypothetical protein
VRPKIPARFARLFQSGRWKHPGDDVLSRVVPFIADPIEFIEAMDWIELESRGNLADSDWAERFKEKRGSRDGLPIELPWRDVEQSIVVAVNRHAGNDVAIALDFRTSRDDPRVIATAWTSDFSACEWREVAPTLSIFLARIGIQEE